MKDMKKFIKETYDYHIEKGILYYVDLKKEKTVELSDAYFFVKEKPDLLKRENQKLTFSLKIGYMKKHADNWGETLTVNLVLSRSRNTVSFEDADAFIQMILKERIIIKNKEKYLDVCKQYFQYVIETSMRKKPDITISCGWVEINNYGFIDFNPIADDTSNRKIAEDFLYGLYAKSPNADILSYDFSFGKILDLLIENPVLIGVFAFTLHAFFSTYKSILGIGNRSKRNLFSICISGAVNKNNSPASVANLFSNVFKMDTEHIHSIPDGYSVSLSARELDYQKIVSCYDVPIIFKNAGQPIKKNSSKVKKIEDAREEDILHGFPVYLSSTSMNADDIVDFNINGVKGIPISLEEYEDLKDTINCLLWHYLVFLQKNQVCELAKCSKNDAVGKKEYDASLKISSVLDNKVRSSFNNKFVDLQRKEYYIALQIAIESFCVYLEYLFSSATGMENELEKTERLCQVALEFFIKSALVTNEYSAEIMGEEIDEISDEYILSFFKQYVQNLPIENKPYLFWLKVETRGKKECYYFDNDNRENSEWFKDFSLYLENQHAHKIPHKRLLRLLKEREISITRNDENRSDFTIARNLKDKNGKVEHYNTVLVVIKAKLDEIPLIQ